MNPSKMQYILAPSQWCEWFCHISISILKYWANDWLHSSLQKGMNDIASFRLWWFRSQDTRISLLKSYQKLGIPSLSDLLGLFRMNSFQFSSLFFNFYDWSILIWKVHETFTWKVLEDKHRSSPKRLVW